jgi:uncharacterized membrane protein
MSEHSGGEDFRGVTRSRIEFLFDGVFAIAMTLLVLELKVPEGIAKHDGHGLWLALVHEAPTFFSYLLSWAMLGMLWWRHHHVFRALQRPNRVSLVLHLVMMAAAAFFPFAAALLGRYKSNPVALPVYAGCVAVYQWAALLLWVAAEKQGCLDPALPPTLVRHRRQRLIRAALVITVIFGVALSAALR